MNRNSFRGIDLAICSSFPVAAFLFVASFALGHSTLGRLAEILLWILFASFIVLPLGSCSTLPSAEAVCQSEYFG
jgi:hypothetical protein